MKKPKAGDDGPKKRQRSVLSGEGSTPGGSPQVFNIEDDPSHSAVPPPEQTVFGDAIFLEPGELWATGVSERLRAVIRPLPRFLDSSPLGSDLLTDLGRIEEETLKAASLIQSLKALHLGYESSSSSSAALTLRVDDLIKERSEFQAQLEELPGLKEKLKKTEADLVSIRADLVSTQAASTEKDAALAGKDADLKKLLADIDEARDMIGRAATEAFDNAMEQAKVLNPGLVTDGMDVLCSVKDGCIVPDTPGHDDGEGEGSERGEGEE